MLDALAPDLPNARVLDLFAGTGALGLEAISRGARSADFVEFRPSSLHALRANVAALKLRERTRIFKKDAVRFAAVWAHCPRRDRCAHRPVRRRAMWRVAHRPTGW